MTFKETRRPLTLAYLSGLLEGEGAFLKPPPSSPEQAAVVLAMTDEDVVGRAALLLETALQAPPYKRKAHHKQVYTARVRGRRAVEVMQALYPLMGARRQRQIEVALAARSLETYRIPYATEVAEMVDLKAAGATRGELAIRYEVHPVTVNRLVGAYGRRDHALTVAAKIKAAEDELAAATGGRTELAWLAGIVEGEGSLEARGVVRVEMADEDVMRRAAAMLGVSLYLKRSLQSNWKPTWCLRVGSQRAVQLVGQLEPAFGQRRRRQAQVVREAVAARGRARVPASRMARNLEIARRLSAGESGPSLAAEFGMTHQNVYFLGKKYKDVAACPRGEGSACKAEYAGSNPVAAST